MPFNEGESVGPYRILEQLGQGGMATVYKAYHAALDRYVALKVLHPAFLEDPNFQARFLREARLVAKLEHPNIVPIYDYAEHEKRPYLVMKFIEGETLKARLGRGPLTSSEISQIVDTVGTALSYAHKQGILHRDIKPSNVLLATDGQIYLADFGLARIAQSGESTLTSDMILGTPQYISPEQALGKKNLDEGTDIYSFGVMLYELVVGQVPFHADTPFSIIHDHIYSPLPLPRSINPNVPETVERVLLKTLAKDRSDRYADVASMVAAFIEAWTASGIPMQGTTITLPVQPASAAKAAPLKGKKSIPPPASKAEAVPLAAATAALAGKPKKRSPWPYIAASVLLVICGLFVFIAFWRGKFQDVILSPQVTATLTAPTLANITPTIAIPPQVATAQSRVAAYPDDPQANLDLALAYWDSQQPRRALETLNHAADLADGNQVFFIDAGHQFATREAWTAAAAMYLRAVKLQSPTQPLPEDLRFALHEAVYKAARSPDMPLNLPFEAIGRVDQPLMLVAQARHTYFNGDPAKGHDYLFELKQLKPDLHEIYLLEAEFDAKEGKIEEARQYLNVLLMDLSTPEWIRTQAKSILKAIS